VEATETGMTLFDFACTVNILVSIVMVSPNLILLALNKSKDEIKTMLVGLKRIKCESKTLADDVIDSR
jgi:hypothetical protein